MAVKVLIAEDDQVTQAVLRRIAESAGGEVISTRCGIEALEILRSFDGPGVAVLDWMLPGMSGVEVCRSIRLGSNLLSKYLILSTAKTDPLEIIQGLEAGANDYVRKPFHPKVLEARLKTGIRQIELQMHATEQNRKMMQHSKMALLGELAAGIVHDIRNPLCIIQGQVDAIERKAKINATGDLSDLQERLSKISVNTGKIAKIIENLLALSRNNLMDKIEAVNIGELISASISLCEYKLKRARVEVEFRFINGEQVIECRPPSIEQVLVNLICNACDAIEALDERWIRIQTELEGPSRLLIRVTDSGAGIPSHLLDQLMTPFLTTKGQGEGTGLGLSIAKRIVEAHSGTIGVNTSSPNTEFQVRLPLRQSESLNTSEKESVLVVEDESDILEVIMAELGTESFNVYSAGDGIAALAILEKQNFMALITDLNMPKMSGLDLIKEIRSRYEDPPLLIAMTANSLIDVGTIEAVGADMVLYKPNGLYDLKKIIRGYLRSPSANSRRVV